MATQESYTVALPSFCGPLDLLLYLIRRAEVDVHDIPIAAITDQYLELLRHLEEVDIDLAGEFLVMAATLVEIKSRTLMPPSDRAEGDDDGDGGGPGAEIDPRAELIQQLLAYQRFRIAGETLDARRHEHARRFPAAGAPEDPATIHEPPPLELDDVHVLDLADAYERIIASIDLTRLGDHRVEDDDTPIALHQEDLLDRLGRAPAHRLTLQDVFAGHGRGQRIGLFLAALELVRLRRIVARQDEIDAPIEIEMVESDATEPAAG